MEAGTKHNGVRNNHREVLPGIMHLQVTDRRAPLRFPPLRFPIIHLPVAFLRKHGLEAELGGAFVVEWVGAIVLHQTFIKPLIVSEKIRLGIG